MSKEAFKAVASGAAEVQADTARTSARELFSKAAESVVGIIGAGYDLAERPGMQGAAELAQALFTGNGYVAYGEGQQSEEPQHGLPQEQEQQRQQERGGMER